jgi:hypothetical protein
MREKSRSLILKGGFVLEIEPNIGIWGGGRGGIKGKKGPNFEIEGIKF